MSTNESGSNESAPNPYAAPAPSYVPVPKGAVRSGRPGWYSFYCIMAIVLGALGAFNALMGIPGLFVGQFVGGMQPAGMPGTPQNVPQNVKEMQEISNEMNRELHAVTKRYFWFSLTEMILLLGFGIALLVGGLRALSMKRSGAAQLAATFMFASVFDSARLVLSIFEQMETGQIMRKHFGPLMEKSQPPNAPNPFSGDFFANVITAALGGIVCFMVAWTIFKLWLYLSGWIYFNKPETQALLKTED